MLGRWAVPVPSHSRPGLNRGLQFDIRELNRVESDDLDSLLAESQIAAPISDLYSRSSVRAAVGLERDTASKEVHDVRADLDLPLKCNAETLKGARDSALARTGHAAAAVATLRRAML